jgi:hypothetical protein
MSTIENSGEKSYNKVQDIISRIISNLDWIQLCGALSILDNPAIPERELEKGECEVSYMKKQVEGGFRITTEGAAWSSSLCLMSWLLQNLKNKAENGHCRQKAHEHPCNEGSNFHDELYRKCLKSFRDIVDEFDGKHPKLVT